MALRTVLFFAWPQFDAVELQFWHRLRDALRAQGLRLVLASDAPAPRGLAVEHFRVPRRVDAVWPLGGAPFEITVADLGIEPRQMLERESDWGVPPTIGPIETHVLDGQDHLASYWAGVLAMLRPVLTVIWNGQHVPEIILDAACRRGGCRVLYVERAPIPNALFVDDRGLSAASEVASQPDWRVRDQGRWGAVAERVNRRMAAGGVTWWEQPASVGGAELRASLGLPPQHRIVLFAGQVDEDTQRFLFSPHFPDNLTAFDWLLAQLQKRDDVFVLGKHHPRSTTSPDAYRRVMDARGVSGVWRDDVSVADALDVSDCVVAVNSTVLYEALARGIPVLAVGEWLMGGRDVAFDLTDLEHSAPLIERWLAGSDSTEQQARWQESLAYLLSTSIYAYQDAAETGGMMGAAELSRRLAEAAGAAWQTPDSLLDVMLSAGASQETWWCPWDAEWRERLEERLDAGSNEWQRWQRLRDAVSHGVNAVRERRRLTVWGTGAAGRLVTQLLASVGVTPGAFVSSSAAPNETLDGVPVLNPAELFLNTRPARDYVLIATTAHAQVSPLLDGLGFQSPRDYDVVDIDSVLALQAEPPLLPARHENRRS